MNKAEKPEFDITESGMSKAKRTDTKRLNWVQENKADITLGIFNGQQEWGVRPHSAGHFSIIKICPTVRQAIDAAMEAKER